MKILTLIAILLLATGCQTLTRITKNIQAVFEPAPPVATPYTPPRNSVCSEPFTVEDRVHIVCEPQPVVDSPF